MHIYYRFMSEYKMHLANDIFIFKQIKKYDNGNKNDFTILNFILNACFNQRKNIYKYIYIYWTFGILLKWKCIFKWLMDGKPLAMRCIAIIVAAIAIQYYSLIGHIKIYAIFAIDFLDLLLSLDFIFASLLY